VRRLTATATIWLLLPVVYLVVAISDVQAAAFVTEGAARDVVRAYVPTRATGVCQ